MNFPFYIPKDEEAMEYLREIGPDTLVPCFAVNVKGNKNVDLCNVVNTALFQNLHHFPGEQTAHRVPLIVTASSMIPDKKRLAVADFEKRLGVSLPPQIYSKPKS